MPATVDRVRKPPGLDVSLERSRWNGRRVLLACGIAASLVHFAAANVLGPLLWEGYSWTDQTWSELFAIDAPSRPLVMTLVIAHAILALAFGIGVLWSAGRNRALRVAGWLLVGIGAVDLMTLPFPMHMRGGEQTLTDTLHVAGTSLTSLLFILAMGFAATALGKGFRLYSVATLATVIVFGVLSAMQGPDVAANEPTPWVGLYERITIVGYLTWRVVLAVVLLRIASPSVPDTPERLPEADSP